MKEAKLLSLKNKITRERKVNKKHKINNNNNNKNMYTEQNLSTFQVKCESQQYPFFCLGNT